VFVDFAIRFSHERKVPVKFAAIFVRRQTREAEHTEGQGPENPWL
jgi:hypothetical protein